MNLEEEIRAVEALALARCPGSPTLTVTVPMPSSVTPEGMLCVFTGMYGELEALATPTVPETDEDSETSSAG